MPRMSRLPKTLGMRKRAHLHLHIRRLALPLSSLHSDERPVGSVSAERLFILTTAGDVVEALSAGIASGLWQASAVFFW